MGDASMLGDVSIRRMDIREECFGLFVDGPADDTHLRCISKALCLTRDRVFLVCSMDEFVTGLTQCDQIIRAIASSFS